MNQARDWEQMAKRDEEVSARSEPKRQGGSRGRSRIQNIEQKGALFPGPSRGIDTESNKRQRVTAVSLTKSGRVTGRIKQIPRSGLNRTAGRRNC
jgi:hypothetical protein